MTWKTAIFGGSFDPPHMGHVISVLHLLEQKNFDIVLIVPCKKHVFGKESSDFSHRLEMCRLAFEVFGDRVIVSDMAADLPEPTYTIDIIRESGASGDGLRTVIGSDCLEDFSKWKHKEEIEKKAPLLVLPRGESKVIPPFSSTSARILFQTRASIIAEESDFRNLDIIEGALKDQLPYSVYDYVCKNFLYICSDEWRKTITDYLDSMEMDIKSGKFKPTEKNLLDYLLTEIEEQDKIDAKEEANV